MNKLIYNWRANIGVITRLIDFVVILSSTLGIALEYNHLPISMYLLGIGTILIFYLISEFQHFYVSWRTTPFLSEAWQVTIIWFLSAFISVSIVTVLDHNLFYGRRHQVSWFVTTWLVLLVYRYIIRKLLRSFRINGHNIRHVAIVGTGELAGELAERIRSNPWMGLKIEYFYDDNLNVYSNKASLGDVYDLEQLIDDARAKKFERVYIALPVTHQNCISNLLKDLADTACTVLYVPDIFTFELLNSRVDNVDGLPVVNIYSTPLNGTNRILKRIFDLIVAGVILLIIAIPMIAIALAIKLSSKGPIFFKQTRYGIQGKPIKVWKFRSMTVMEDGNIVTQAKAGDSRLTPIGGFLRRTSLDELPQFFNVIQGSMSIVGPRPHAVAHNEIYRKVINGYMLRHMVKPGITGWAQINGWRGETDTVEKMEKRVEYDLEYIRNWSIFLDIKIIFLTIFKGFVGRNVY
ncbi:undecaprenyl-phosphate glucose phosphotransferase [Celerinatantimonas diazotrophica]|uniref:Putative colanic acid biosynthesis UDP-glucose lipid carrier transferase n=1 Tax=Celerinatantimonas diazotrophica TaxID=412034 RepID=A0A4R1K7M5_9GAMM|nr:undecaprenyl-phosphate glucose phosphotransferase [Celerinatantimonas diazotrophica]TCK59069.1 putative colanic acid biosynthesis UDP-glucose lipid carrier transferase [Celerinatantimonas diazotrophica]CAG9297704.1 UDP-glucose:undecaprenyl-phosphate glucose-1-phosphate transferase [Celerinatantimonas diazotrophica]